MGATNGRPYVDYGKMNSSLSQDSDVSLSAASADFSLTPPRNRKSVSFQDGDDSSGRSEQDSYDLTSGQGSSCPPSGHRNMSHLSFAVRRDEAIPVYPPRAPVGRVPPEEPCCNKLPLPATTQLLGRTSPGHDLGYHTLVTRAVCTPPPPPPPVTVCTPLVTSLGTPGPCPYPRCFVTPSWHVPPPSSSSSSSCTSASLVHPHCCTSCRSAQCPACGASVPVAPPPPPPPPPIPLSRLQMQLQRPPPPPSSSSSTVDFGLLPSYKGKCGRVSPFDRLPDDLVVKIFSYLSANQLGHCAKTCRRWYHLVWEPRLWTVVELTGEKTPVDKALKSLLRLLARAGLCLGVERVSLNGCVRLTDKGLSNLVRACPELRRLELRSCRNVTNVGILELVTHCVNIEHLDVTGCFRINCIDISSNPGKKVTGDLSFPDPERSVHCRQLYLQFLDLTDCHGIEDQGLKVIVRNCPQLTHLYLRRCVQMTDVGVKHVAAYCMMLREASVSDCVQVTDFGLYELAKLGANLRYLSVAKCDQVSDAGVKQIARHCYKLRYLNVRGCEAVSDDSLVVLARSCPRLRALDVGKCDVTDHGLKLLSEHCPNLKKLSVKSCDMVSDKGIQCIAYYCRGLQQLNIQDCAAITADGYRTVKKYCKRCIIEHTNPGFC